MEVLVVSIMVILLEKPRLMKEVPGTICQKKHGRKVGDFQAQITSLTHNFRGKPGTTLAIIKVQYSMEQHHKERKRKSSSGKSPFGSTALNGRSSSTSALSLINFFSHNFQVKPVIGLDYLTRYYFDE